MPAKDAKEAQAEPGFEKALARLEAVVGELEGGRVSLEESLKKYTEGMELSAYCAKKLGEAEKKIEILLRKNPDAPEWGTFADPPPSHQAEG